MADAYHLSFAVGPVQRFVAQARRTRDLWAGSWLLSYLAESAMAAAERVGDEEGDRTLIPNRQKGDRGIVTAIRSPIGGMPNRFELLFTGDHARQRAIDAAGKATEAFNDTWRRVTHAVFEAFLTDDVLDLGSGTGEIWQRQRENFWELSWVVGKPDEHEQTIGRLAAMRKNFRNVRATEEPGVKCSLIPTLQEISGHSGRGAREKQQRFWQALQNKVGDLDIGDAERLCTIALSKRLFPKVIQSAIGNGISSGLRQVGWPSTAFMAAIPWLKELSTNARHDAEQFQRQALSTDVGYQDSERQAARDAGIDWAVADGPIWFASAVRNDEPGRQKLGAKPSTELLKTRQQKVKKLLDELSNVYRVAGGEPGEEQRRPIPYYAMLLLDGDSMGQLLGQLGSPEKLSECLGRFAGNVEDIIRKHDGRTVYAGGDDVLALLPARSALDAAVELRRTYADAFRTDGVSAEVATISASVVFAHWRYPLRQVLRTAHELLDSIAKETTGRDAIAIGIVLSSGLNAVWSVPWDVFHGNATIGKCSSVSLTKVLNRFEVREIDDSSDPPFNTSFLYLLRERFAHLLGKGREEPGEFLRFSTVSAPQDLDTATLLRDLAHAEYRRRMKKKDRASKQESETKAVIDELMSLSRQWMRNQTAAGPNRTTEIHCDPNSFSFDGWRIARFLKQIKDGRVGDHD